MDYISIMRSRKKKIDEDQLPHRHQGRPARGYQPYCPSMEQVISRFGRLLVQTPWSCSPRTKMERSASRSDILQYLAGAEAALLHHHAARHPLRTGGAGHGPGGQDPAGDPAVRIRAAVFGRPACGRVSPLCGVLD